jgi:hypothetical protein
MPEVVITPPPPDALSFVTWRKGGGFNYWDVTPTGSYDDDCKTGEALAREYLTFRDAWPGWTTTTFLDRIVRDMIKQQRWSGVHLGFLVGVKRLWQWQLPPAAGRNATSLGMMLEGKN